MKGRIIKEGTAKGQALVTLKPISFYGGVDPDTGKITEKNHPLKGKSMKGKVLVFPCGKGSTVGSYIIYRLKKNGNAPIGIINKESEPIVAVGAIISDIPMVDKIDIKKIKNGDEIIIKGEVVECQKN